MNFFTETLAAIRAAYAKKPLEDIRLARPAWLTAADPLSAVYQEKATLLRQGTICYAHIVQANTILFKWLPHVDCPAQIVYSTDPRVAEKPGLLRQTAMELFRYKNQPPERVPEQWREIAGCITDEYDRTGFTFSIDCDGQRVEFHMKPVMIFRSLLPGRVLRGSLLPVLTAPDCRSVLVLPKRYWTREFTKLWIHGKI